MPEGKHILIVDDEEFLCVTVADILRDANFRVSIAHDGSEVSPILDQGKVDLVLLDLMMPRMGGFETLELIKKKAPSTGVIMFSAFGSRDQVEQGVKLGADGFINKPFGIDTLLKRIEEVVAGKSKSPFHEPGIE
jgi:DNA-binding response OmpR family regulator